MDKRTEQLIKDAKIEERARILAIQELGSYGIADIVKDAINQGLSVEKAHEYFKKTASIEALASYEWDHDEKIRKEFRYGKGSYVAYCKRVKSK